MIMIRTLFDLWFGLVYNCSGGSWALNWGNNEIRLIDYKINKMNKMEEP